MMSMRGKRRMRFLVPGILAVVVAGFGLLLSGEPGWSAAPTSAVELEAEVGLGLEPAVTGGERDDVSLLTSGSATVPACVLFLAKHLSGEAELAPADLALILSECEELEVPCVPGACCCGGPLEPLCCDATCVTVCMDEEECCKCEVN